MLSRFFLFTILLVLFSCHKKNNLNITLENKTLNSGDTGSVTICIEDSVDSFSGFFIIRPLQKDTVRIPHHSKEFVCGYFSFETDIIGTFKYNGYVEYFNKKQEFIVSKYTIEYKVID